MLSFPAGLPGRPTDQFIPPGLPGFKDVSINPLGGPDLARAKRLAGAGRRHGTLYTCSLPPCLEQARVARQNLLAIGIDLEINSVGVRKYFSGFLDDKPWDLAYGNFFIDYADPANFIGALVKPEVRGRFVHRIRAASRLPDASRLDAFARLDADLARAAILAPFATSTTTDFFSDRIGCQVHQPIYGISLGALCLRR